MGMIVHCEAVFSQDHLIVHSAPSNKSQFIVAQLRLTDETQDMSSNTPQYNQTYKRLCKQYILYHDVFIRRPFSSSNIE